MLDACLVILKFAGLILAGTLGILGTLVETRDDVVSNGQKKKRLNRWGKWALALTIVGFAVALIAQSAEEMKGTRDGRKAQQRAQELLESLNNQSALTQQSLDGIERVITEFEEFAASAIYSIPIEDPRLVTLKRQFEELSRERPSESKAISYVYINGECSEVRIRLGDEFYPADPGLTELLTALKSPRLWIGFYRTPRNLAKISTSRWGHDPDADLFVFAHDNVFDTELRYALESGQLSVHWNAFNYPKAKWVTNRQITSIRDAGESQIAFALNPSRPSGLPTEIFKAMRPVEIRIRFDNQFSVLTEFYEREDAHFGVLSSVKLPPASEILGVGN